MFLHQNAEGAKLRIGWRGHAAALIMTAALGLKEKISAMTRLRAQTLMDYFLMIVSSAKKKSSVCRIRTTTVTMMMTTMITATSTKT